MSKYPTKFTPQIQTAFLKLYRECGVINTCAHTLQISPETPRQHALKHEDFKEGMAEALQDYRDMLENEAHRRAVTGIKRAIYYKGEVVGHELLYSDRILELKLKRNIPEYRDKFSLDVEHKGGVLVVHTVALSSKEWEDETK